MEIIERILNLIDKSGRSRNNFCREIGFNPSSLQTLATRKTDPPARFIAPMAKALGVTTDELLTGEPGPNIVLDAREEEIILDYRSFGPYTKDKIYRYVRGLKADSDAHNVQGYQFGRNKL